MTSGYPARYDSTTRESLVDSRGFRGFPSKSNVSDNGIFGYPEPLRTKPGLSVLRSAVFFIDAQYAQQNEPSAKNQGTGGFALNARYGSSLAIGAADTTDPVLLPWTGENYWYQTGSLNSSNFVATPSTDDISITGDISIAVEVQLDETIVDKPLLIKRESGVDSALLPYNFKCFNSGGLGTLALLWTNAAGTGLVVYGIVAHGIQVGQKAWLGASLDVNNGSGGYTCRFYKSFDGVNWTNYETQIVNTGVTDIRVNAAQVGIAGTNAGVMGPAGKYFNAKIWSGLDFTATPVLNWSANDMGQNTGTSNGRVWTPVRSGSGRKGALVTRPVWLFGTDDYMEVANNDLLNMGASQSFTVLAVIRQWAAPTNFGVIVGKTTGLSASTQGWAMYNQTTTTQGVAFISDGVTAKFAGGTTPSSGDMNTKSIVVNRSIENIGFTTNTTKSAPTSTVGVGTLLNSVPLTIGRFTAGFYQDFELLAVAVWRRALTASEIAQINAYYGTA